MVTVRSTPLIASRLKSVEVLIGDRSARIGGNPYERCLLYWREHRQVGVITRVEEMAVFGTLDTWRGRPMAASLQNRTTTPMALLTPSGHFKRISARLLHRGFSGVPLAPNERS